MSAVVKSAVSWRMIFSGLNLVVAGPQKAAVAAMRVDSGGAAHGHEGEVSEHYPILIVAADQLEGPVDQRPSPVTDLSEHIKHGWLPTATQWLAFEIADYDLSYIGLDVYTGMIVPNPGPVSQCPIDDGWEDLGWLVPFSTKFPKGVFEPYWERNKDVVACHTILTSGYLYGASPVDVPLGGPKIYDYANRCQVFSDSCLWRSASSNGSVTVACKPREAGVEKSIVLSSRNGRAIHCYLFNHPKNPRTVGRGWHLDVVKHVFAKGQNHIPPDPTGKQCRLPGVVANRTRHSESGVTIHAELQLPVEGGGSIVVKTVGGSTPSIAMPQDHSGHAGPNIMGEEYCAEGLVWEP